MSKQLRIILALASVALAGGLAFWFSPVVRPAEAATRVEVYMSPTCPCCHGWVEHMKEEGFEVEVHKTDELVAIKKQEGVPEGLTSCHTSKVGGYAVEGHVPADVIRKLLEEKPEVEGIAVGGMPMGSPGMEGGTPEPYDVMSFDAAGQTQVFARK